MEGKYKCVHCGFPAVTLYNRYGPSVLKLNKCVECGCHVDKYIEYDQVIVAIDLILISREAQRHVIYNTDFKSYWKIFVVLTMLETYGVWHDNSLLTTAIEAACALQHSSPAHCEHSLCIFPDLMQKSCKVWTEQVRVDDVDMFIWEKNFYIHFVSVFIGVTAFIMCLHMMMKVSSWFRPQNKVSIVHTVKAFTLAYVSVLFTAPALVWGAPPEGTPPATPTPHALHHVLAFAYSLLVFFNVFTVMQAGPAALVALALLCGLGAKLLLTFITTPLLHCLIA